VRLRLLICGIEIWWSAVHHSIIIYRLYLIFSSFATSDFPYIWICEYEYHTHLTGCLGSAVVERQTCDRKVTVSIPSWGTIKSTRSAFHPCGVGKSSTNLHSWGLAGCIYLCWVAYVWSHMIWQVTSRSSEMGFPGRAILAFTFTFLDVSKCPYDHSNWNVK